MTTPTDPLGPDRSPRPHRDTTKATAPGMDTSHDDSTLGQATSRRGFLKVGGLSVAVAAFAAACVQQVKTTEKMAQTGTIIPAPSTSEPVFPGSTAMDATFVLTGLSLEKLLVETYEQVLTSNWLSTASFTAVAREFQEQHEAHIAPLESLARSMGQDPSKVDANETVKTEEVDPAIETIKTDGADKVKVETDALTMLLGLEDTIGQMYAKAGGEGTTAPLRAQFASLGSTEARHFAVLAGAIGRPAAPFALQHTAPAALTDEAYVQPDTKMLPTTPGTTTGTAKP